MKKLYLFFVLLLIAAAGSAQTVLYQDDLESYPDDSYLAVENPTWWSTWSNLPGSYEDIQIKNMGGHSGTRSGIVDTVGGPADALLLLDENFTGAYELSWWMYIEAGKCGYYNIQHFETPGQEYAMHVFFRANGTFELTAGGETFTGTYPQGAWFEVKHFIDLDLDYISLYINGIFVHDWPFSYQVYYGYGTAQLGAVDFGAYAATGSNEDPRYFIDDVLYQELPAPPVPAIQVDPTSIAIAITEGWTEQRFMSVFNTGVTDLTYDINILYGTGKSALTLNPGQEAAAPDAEAKLHYDGDHSISIGWSTPPVTVTVAARFPNLLTLPYAGMELKSVEVYIDQLNAGVNTCTIRIFGMGSSNTPGVLLSSETFTPEGGGWDTVTLTTPVMLTGEDLWVGYTFTQTDPGIYFAGVDAGPANPNGDFLNTGSGWFHLSEWTGFNNNWNIRANLEGTPFNQWLSAYPMQDTIAPGTSTSLDVYFDANGLALGQYTATLRFLSNDPVNPQLDVPVLMDVVGVGIDEADQAAVLVFPNPAKDRLYIRSDHAVSKVTITNSEGKVMYAGQDPVIDIRNWAPAAYYVTTVTEKGTSNIQVIKTR